MLSQKRPRDIGTLKDCLRIGWWCFVVFYYVAIFSHHPQDPSFYAALSPDLGSRHNLAGIMGAELSAHLLMWLGGCAYLLPLILSYCLYGKAHGLVSGLKTLLYALWLLGLVCLWAALFSVHQDWGGWIGSDLRRMGMRHFGSAGLWIAALSLTAITTRHAFEFTIITHAQRLIVLVTRIAYKSATAVKRSLWIIQKHLISHLHKMALSTPLKNITTKAHELSVKLSEQPRLQTKPASSVSLGLSSQTNWNTNQRILNTEVSNTHQPQQSLIKKPVSDTHKADSDTQKTSLFFSRNKPNTPTQILINPSIKPPTPSSPHLDDNSHHTHHQTPDHPHNSSQEEHLAEVLKKTLLDFHIKGQLHGTDSGPRLITYEFEPESGIKQTKLTSLADDIARALKVESVLIQPIAQKSSLGIQVPREDPYMVHLQHSGEVDHTHALPVALGVTPSGDWVKVDLASMPHLLMAGATGSGKSVGIHALINSLICSRSPTEVRLVLVDPKMLELSAYHQLPHLASPVITEPTLACSALRWAVDEMERRYRMMQDMEVRHMKDFNAAWRALSGEQRQQWLETYPDTDLMPYLVIIIDELADLMLIAPKDVEGLIQRLSQKARASGIHLVLATQRPSVDVITGVIKANFPARIAYQVVSKHDSRTILDQIGAEKLLGKGDMLYQDPKRIRPMRLQGAYVSEKHIKSLIISLHQRYSQNHLLSLTKELEAPESDHSQSYSRDAKWDEALSIAESKGSISASFLQRKLQIGYNRAARIIEMMEQENYVAPMCGSKPRPWLGH